MTTGGPFPKMVRGHATQKWLLPLDAERYTNSSNIIFVLGKATYVY